METHRTKHNSHSLASQNGKVSHQAEILRSDERLPVANNTLSRTINVITEETSKIKGREKILLLAGSGVEGQYKSNISDIDVLITFVDRKNNMPYINLDELSKLTGSVRRTVERLNDEGIYIVTVPQYTSGIFMIDSAKHNIAESKGVSSKSINVAELQVRLYANVDEAILTENLPDLLGSFFRTGRALVGNEFMPANLEYISQHTNAQSMDPFTSRLIDVRKMLISAYNTYATNIHLTGESLFIQALRVSKDMVVELTEEYLRSKETHISPWSYSILYQNKDMFPDAIRAHAELVYQQRELVSNNHQPTISTEELYRSAINTFNFIASQHDSHLKNQLIVTRRA